MSDLYLQRDLTDYADEYTKEKPYISRKKLLRNMLPDDAAIDHHTTGGYQGLHGYVIVLDGYWWLLKDAYGSCSYCDGLLSAAQDSPEKVEEYGLSMMRNAYCFDTEADARAFLDAKVSDEDHWGWGWPEIADGMLNVMGTMPDPA